MKAQIPDYLQSKIDELMKNVEKLNILFAEASKKNMLFSKNITVNIGNYETVRLGVENAASFEDANEVLLEELHASQVNASSNIQMFLGLKKKKTLSTTIDAVKTVSKGDKP